MFRKVANFTNKSSHLMMRPQTRQFAPQTATSTHQSTDVNPLYEKILKKSEGGRALAQTVT